MPDREGPLWAELQQHMQAARARQERMQPWMDER
jgi:hypothetical protein